MWYLCLWFMAKCSSGTRCLAITHIFCVTIFFILVDPLFSWYNWYLKRFMPLLLLSCFFTSCILLLTCASFYFRSDPICLPMFTTPTPWESHAISTSRRPPWLPILARLHRVRGRLGVLQPHGMHFCLILLSLCSISI